MYEDIYTEDELLQIWENARIIRGYDPKIVRRDMFSNPIEWKNYGKEVATGWKVAHGIPPSWGGSDKLTNLRPMHWSGTVNREPITEPVSPTRDEVVLSE